MAQKFLQLLFVLSVSASSVLGQVAITGQIRGVVTDATGGSLPNVDISATSPALMSPRKTTTDVSGSYLVEALSPGTYALTYAVTGFRIQVQQDLAISPGFTATISPQLQIGTTEQSVVVSADPPIVDTATNTTATTFDEALLQGIPSGRDTFSTVAQAPGVATSDFGIAGSQSFQQSVMEVHGSVPGDQVYSFNGLRLNYAGLTGGFTSFYVDNDSLSELQVVTDSAPAEVGVGGVYMNLVPKSGANTVHELAAAYYQSAATQATITNPIYNGTPV